MIAKYRYGGKARGGNVRREEDPAFGKYSKDAFRAYLVVFDILLFVLNLLHRVYVVRYFFVGFVSGLVETWVVSGLVETRFVSGLVETRFVSKLCETGVSLVCVRPNLSLDCVR